MRWSEVMCWSIPKHLVIFLVVAVGGLLVYQQLTKVNNNDELAIIATVGGLALTAAVAGYIQFSFKNVCRGNKAHLWLAHVATGLNLFVIGLLLVVAACCIHKIRALDGWFRALAFVGAGVLCLAMVLYDVVDLAMCDDVRR